MALIHYLEFHEEIVVLLLFYKDAATDPSWLIMGQPFTIKCLAVFSLKSLVLVFIRIYLFPSYLELIMSLESQNLPDWKSHEWVYCPNPNAPSFFILLLHWPPCFKPKMAAVWSKWQAKPWQPLSENQMENPFCLRIR